MQWKTFNEWQQNRVSHLTFGERVAWYAAAFDFVRNSLGMAASVDKRDKSDFIRDVHMRLKFLKRTDPDG